MYYMNSIHVCMYMQSFTVVVGLILLIIVMLERLYLARSEVKLLVGECPVLVPVTVLFFLASTTYY